jgi:hypothetical protein
VIEEILVLKALSLKKILENVPPAKLEIVEYAVMEILVKIV